MCACECECECAEDYVSVSVSVSVVCLNASACESRSVFFWKGKIKFMMFIPYVSLSVN